MPEMTWGEFKAEMESNGVTDDCELNAIEFNKDDEKMLVMRNDEGEVEVYSE